jgi:superfamily II DNA or RNA helicase
MTLPSNAAPELQAILLCPNDNKYISTCTSEVGSKVLRAKMSQAVLGLDWSSSQISTINRVPMWVHYLSPGRSRPVFSRQFNFEFSLKYCFSNNEYVDAIDILFHPYAKHLPVELLPLSLVFSEWGKEPSDSYYASGATGLKEHLIEVFWRVTEWGRNLPHYKGVRAMVGTQISEDKWRAWPVTGVEFLQTTLQSVPFLRPLIKGNITHRPQELSLQIGPGKHEDALEQGEGYAQVRLSCLNLPNHALIGRDFYFDKDQGTVCFHRYPDSFRAFAWTTGHMELDGEWPKKLSYEVSLSGHDRITKTINTLVEDLSPQVETDWPHVELEKTDLNCQYHFSGSSVAIFHSLQNGGHNIGVWNFTSEFDSIVRVLSGGLQNAHGVDAEKLKSRRRDSRRANDLKVLRHKGLGYYFVYRSLSFIVENSDAVMSNQIQPNDIKKLLDNIFSEMGNIIRTHSGWDTQKHQKSLTEICSKQLIAGLGETFHIWLERAITPKSMYGPSALYSIYGLSFSGYRLVLAQLNELLKISNGELFLRPAKVYFVPPKFDWVKANARTQELKQNGISIPFSDSELAPQWSPEWFDDESRDSTIEISSQILLEGDQTPVQGFTSYSYVDPKLAALPDYRPWLELATDKKTSVWVDGKPLQMLTSEMLQASLVVGAGDPKSEGDSSQNDHGAIDWFALNPQFFFNGKEVQVSDLRFHDGRVIEHENRLYVIDEKKQLPSLRALNWFWQKLAAKHTGKSNSTKERGFLHIPKNETLELLALRASGVSVTGDNTWNEICNFYDQLNQPRTALDLGNDFRGDLKVYQDTGVQWLNDLYQLKMGGILADDMGLGKTVQALAFLEHLRQSGKLGRSLIIVPTSLSYNWIEETARFTPKLPFYRFQSNRSGEFDDYLRENPSAVVLISYGRFFENLELFQSYAWDIHIYDEAQNLKNIRAKRTHAARAVPAKFKLCMTGTPMENHFDELFSLLDLVVPGALGKYSHFVAQYVRNENVTAEDLSFLKLKIKPLILRRHKSQILRDLPARVDQVLKIPFEAEQKRIYRDIAVSWNTKVMDVISQKGEGESQLQMLTALLRLRQSCSDPASIPGVKYNKVPPKLVVLLAAIQEIIESGECVLIFTQFLGTLNHIERLLKERGVPLYIMHGGLTQRKREDVLRGFDQEKQGAVFLMTLKTGGVGLNLTKANYVFHIEPWWNPAVENQATDRVHRIGQNKSVTVYRYLMHNSVEEKVEMLKDRKAKRFVSLFGEEESAETLSGENQHITREDFLYLIR